MTLSTQDKGAACFYGLLLSTIILFIMLFWGFSFFANASKEVVRDWLPIIVLAIGVLFFLSSLALGAEETEAQYFGMIIGGIIIVIELFWGLNVFKPEEGIWGHFVMVLIGLLIFIVANSFLAKHDGIATTYAIIFGGTIIVVSLILMIFCDFDLLAASFIIFVGAAIAIFGFFELD